MGATQILIYPAAVGNSGAILRFSEITIALVRFNHVFSLIANANDNIV